MRCAVVKIVGEHLAARHGRQVPDFAAAKRRFKAAKKSQVRFLSLPVKKYDSPMDNG
jgi:hypothetical protein